MDISQELHTIAEYSRDEAQRTGCYLIGAEHLLLAILRLSGCSANQVLSAVCHNTEGLKTALDNSIRTGRHIPFEDADAIIPDEEANNCMSLAVVEAGKLGSQSTGSEHLLLSISRYASKPCRDILSSFGSSPEAIVSTIISALPASQNGNHIHASESQQGATESAESFLLNEMNRLAYDKSITPSKKSERS